MIAVGCILSAFAVVCFVISVRHFLEKGVPFNNMYLFSSESERETVKWKLVFRQTAVVFLLLGLMWVVGAVSCFTGLNKLMWGVVLIALVTVIYAVVSTFKIQKNG